NWILQAAVRDLGVKRIITTKLEHHAVLNTVKYLAQTYGIEVVFLAIQPTSEIDYDQLERLLQEDTKTLVSLMHVNNEVGTELDLEKVAHWCETHQALFHCDTVQSVGKKRLDLSALPIDFIVASAHKFH